MPVSRRLPKALQNETRVSMILSRAQVLFGSELKARLSEMIDSTSGSLDKTPLSSVDTPSRKREKKFSKLFETFLHFCVPRM
jgi:hypothetical protein